MRFVLLGAPGCGKGTQSALLQKKYGIPGISTGDILRAAIAAGTPIGEKAKTYVTTGALVPDEVILELVEHRIDQPDAGAGFILDGFPRSIPQAEGLEGFLGQRGWKLDRVLKIDVQKKAILERMTSRRVCPGCGAVFNVLTQPPQKPGICDACGTGLIQRDDDTEETVRKRLNVYESATAPLIDYYDAKGLLSIIHGDGQVDQVFNQIVDALARALSASRAQAGGRTQNPGGR